MVQSSTGEIGVPLEILLPETAGSTAGEIALQGLQLDSRQLAAGDGFVALPGDVHDGRDYLVAAEAAGAILVIAERGVTAAQRAGVGIPVIEIEGLAARLGPIAATFFGEPGAAMHVVGVTGTNGKTTTTRLLAQLLRHYGGQCGVIGTLGASLDDGVKEALNTTPDAISIQACLADWRQQAVQYAALEVSSHSLDQRRVVGVPFEVAIFTNLSHDHLDYHGDMHRYGQAKARLFKQSGLKVAVLNRDDLYAEEIAAVVKGKGIEVLQYSCKASSSGKESSAALWVEEVNFHSGGVSALLHTPWGEAELRSTLVGSFNLSNLLAAIAAAGALGMPLDAIAAAVPELQGAPGRMQSVTNPHGVQVVIDYAHTPDALEQALLALRVHTSGELWCVFGCGGDRDIDKRPHMGRIAAACADQVIVTSDNPRSESPDQIIEAILGGCESPMLVEADRAAAIAQAITGARAGDCILVAGKGHEAYQQVGEHRLPFDDVQQARLALAQRANP
jgi:UDP-N-acetylmuramoyl-L-alanyl-D-glutamate--2,6-diaminopimelate ligase